MEFSELSKQITHNLSKIDKKKNGIYFTPPSCIQKCLDIIKPYIKNNTNVLEPSCGSCEFITALSKVTKVKKITGIEHNNTIYNSIKHLSTDKIQIHHQDFLKYENGENYKLIVGNPPYFVMKKKDVDKKYYDYFDGRPNIFILFIIKCLKMLKYNGILSFVLPKSFLNCLYYDKTRKYINDNLFQIINIIECDDKYLDTQQPTILLTLQKNRKYCHNDNFLLKINGYTIFGTHNDIKNLKKIYNNSTSLHNLNLKVHVGTVVWNQHKNILSNDTTKTRLVYSSNIVNNQFIDKDFKNEAKKKFIDWPGCNRPLLVINRGYGVGKYNFEYCLLDGSFPYLIENHLIYITSNHKNEKKIKLYKDIIKSLEDERTKNFINLYFGNSAINTTELEYILPIYGCSNLNLS